MTPENRETIHRVEGAIHRAKRILGRHEYPDDLRTVLVIGFIDQMVEHHEAIVLLLRSEKIGSAFALARSVVEAMYRGLWLNFCATDTQCERFERADEIPGITQLANEIDEEYRAGDFFIDL